MSTHRNDDTTRAELETLRALEDVALRGLDTYKEVGKALAGVRDSQLFRYTHPTFETYLRERWGLDRPLNELPEPGVDPTGAWQPASAARIDKRIASDMSARLRWLAAISSGTMIDIVHELETRGMDLDEQTRQQLCDDISVLEEGLVALDLLLAPIDWDARFTQLLDGDVPPLPADAEPDEEE